MRSFESSATDRNDGRLPVPPIGSVLLTAFGKKVACSAAICCAWSPAAGCSFIRPSTTRRDLLSPKLSRSALPLYASTAVVRPNYYRIGRPHVRKRCDLERRRKPHGPLPRRSTDFCTNPLR